MDAIPVSDTKAARRRTGRLTKDERAMRRMEREAEDKLTAALQSLGKRIMANLSDVQTEALPAVVLARIDDPNTWLPFRDVLIEFLKDAALSGADLGRRQVEQGVFGVRKAVSASFNVDWDLANTSAAQWAQQHGAMLVSGLAGTTRDRVASEVRYFVENGLPLSELRKRIMNIETGAFSGARAQTIAVTETTRAFAEGNVAAWQQSGVIMAYEWDTANDEITCPICGRLKGMRVPMGQGFGRYGRPPAHPNCRCGLLPVVEVPELEGLPQYVQWTGADAGQVEQASIATGLTSAIRNDPLGMSVGQSLDLTRLSPEIREQLMQSIGMIDDVHGTNNLPTISIRPYSGKATYGMYSFHPSTLRQDTRPIDIAISIADSTTPISRRSTILHEIGHFLDNQAMRRNSAVNAADVQGVDYFSKSRSPLIQEWRTAVKNSRLVADWQTVKTTSTNASRKKIANYALSTEELWARSYEQYVVTRAGNAELRAYHQDVNQRSGYSWQWDDDDFEPIAQAIDNLFRLFGWIA